MSNMCTDNYLDTFQLGIKGLLGEYRLFIVQFDADAFIHTMTVT